MNIKWFIAAIACTIILLCLTHLPPQMMPTGISINGLDKIVHFSAYAVTFLCFVLSLRYKISLPSIFAVFLFLAVLGAIDELTQPLFNRTASFSDYLADILGIGFTLSFSFYYLGLRSKISLNNK